MSDQEIYALFSIASTFAVKTYLELYNQQPDTSQEPTNQLLNTIVQAWLSGYNYLRNASKLSITIDESFGFYIEID